MMIMLAKEVQGLDLQPRYCGTDFRCVTYRELEKETGVEYVLIDNIWKQK